MHFWLELPALFKTTAIFSPRLRTIPPTLSNPVQTSVRLLGPFDPPTALQKFLQNFFGQPPARPRLLPNLSPSISEHILTIQTHQTHQTHQAHLSETSQSKIIGSIRYRANACLFLPANVQISVIDCFCVHPSYQKKGIGTALLSHLHHFTMKRGHKYSIFLKEGAPIFAPIPPLYSSTYAYRRPQPRRSPNVRQIYQFQAVALVKLYCQIFTNTFVLLPSTNNRTKTYWFFWLGPDLKWLLAVFQDAYQEHPSGGRIFTLSGVLSSPTLSPAHYQEALEETVSHFATHVPLLSWIWTDASFIREQRNPADWQKDGPFHWYSYQWDTSLFPQAKGYILCV